MMAKVCLEFSVTKKMKKLENKWIARRNLVEMKKLLDASRVPHELYLQSIVK